ncbi:MAG: hypothetical protein K0Q74_986, partial [Gammaproteobacteria bacterium]|nr:hypothetical protein [Gammaproteobacteria bacterium]
MQLNRDNELLIPADGDCLYTSAFVAYLLPVRINGAQFHMRLQKLLKINITESLAEIFREKFIRYLGNVNFYRTPEFKKLIKKFKANINVHNQWGGAAEIKIISEYLEINIQEFIENPEDGVPYVQSDIAQYLADGPDQLNTIFILRAVPEFVEAIQPSADIEMQIAQMESVAESQQHAQHYRLFLSNPLNVPLDVSTRKISDKKDGEDDESGSDNSSTEAPEIGAGENGANNVAIPNLNFIRLILAISTASRAFTFLQSFFSFSLPIPNLMIAMATVLSDTHKEGTLLSKAPEFVENMPLFRHPSLKVSEFNSIWILITRVLMVMYRDCFEVLMTSEPISSDLCFKVFDNFLRKIIGSGDLDTYYVSAKNKIQQQIEAEPENKSQHEAMLEFFEGFIRFLRYIGSEAVNDPAQDPLNAYVNLKWISEVNQIDEWLEKNPGHPDYKDEQNRARKLGDFIASRRFQKMRELGEHVFSLLKQMEPELADIGNPSDLIPYIEAEHQKRTRKEFENYLLNDFKKFDIFEPNQLRAFEEQLQRYQYGKIYYEIVCESFQDEFKESRVHRVAQIVWAVSQLDTIHEVPQEASIFDHPKNHIFPPEYDEHDGSCIDCAEYCELGRTYSKYHDFAFPFARYLLENIFETEFVNGENIFDQLKDIVGAKEDLMRKAEEALKALKVFSKHMLRLRPSQASAALGKSEKLGLVFGIGFNGELFNSPFHSESDENEIWINFSASGREGGGHLLLTFIGHVAQWGGNKLFGISNITAALERYFEKYKILIEMKLDELCEYFARSPELTAKYTRFLNECKCLADEKVAFASLSQEFKDWLCDPANLWYSIPAHPGGIKKIKIKIPPNMEKYEHNAQIFARELLFDVLTQPAFFKSEIYHHLMPYLFQHWRKEILVELGRKNLTTM